MTSWLKWRLSALLGTALLIGGGTTYLSAQNSYPAPAATPEEAGAQFYELLHLGTVQPPFDPEMGSRPSFDWKHASAKMGSVSRLQMQKDGSMDRLLALLAGEANEPQFDADVVETNNDQTVVKVGPAAHPHNREVVVIAEDGGYRVDLKATYAHWNNLSGEELEKRWFTYTGTVSPALSQSGTFLRSQCQSNLKQQMLGILQYTQDYDERYPSAREWIDVLQPYVKSEQIFKCPAMPKAGNGYAYNQRFSRISLASVENVSTSINIYETSNPSRNWFGPGTGRAYRHLDGWNLAFADGHVKWLKRDNDMSAYTFFPSAPR